MVRGGGGGGGRSLSKNVGCHGYPTTKIKKTLANLIFGILFLTILFRTYNAFILVHMFQWTLSDLFFNFQILYQKVSEPTKTSKKDHSFYNTVSLKVPHSFYEPQLTSHWKWYAPATQPKSFLQFPSKYVTWYFHLQH